MRIELPVQIGDKLWLAKCAASQETTKCSICCGHKSVWVRNIEGDEYNIRCEACRAGQECPTGVETFWSYEAKAIPFEVASIPLCECEDGVWNIFVKSRLGEYEELKSLFKTEAEALAESKRLMEKAVAQKMVQNANRKKHSLGGHTFSVKDHNQEIKRAEGIIEWHRSRLLSIKKGKKP